MNRRRAFHFEGLQSSLKQTVEGRVEVKGAVHHKATQIYYAHILIPIPRFLNFSLSLV